MIFIDTYVQVIMLEFLMHCIRLKYLNNNNNYTIQKSYWNTPWHTDLMIFNFRILQIK